jgi:hypothetical protein
LRFTGEEYMRHDEPDRKLFFTDTGNVTHKENNNDLENKESSL